MFSAQTDGMCYNSKKMCFPKHLEKGESRQNDLNYSSMPTEKFHAASVSILNSQVH